MRVRCAAVVLCSCIGLSLGACGGEDGADPASGGKSGSGGAAGAAGSGASGGLGGVAGVGGSVSLGGSGSTGGAAGAAGAAGSGGAGGYDLHAADRKSCKFTSGTKTTESIGPQVPHGDALPFQHIVVLMMENRSFDHYFAKLPDAGKTDVDVPPANFSNPDPDASGAPVSIFHETRYCVQDVAHDWEPTHQQYDSGKMDGFVATNNPGGARAMGYYTEQDLPYYYWMAKTFAMSDRHFCSLLGPTWPNRHFFYAGTSWGSVKTGDFGFLANSVYQNSDKITDLLEGAGKSWKIYRDGIVSFAVIYGLKFAGVGMDQFDKDVDADTLPNVAILDPSFTGGSQNDEHPPSNMQLGQALTARVLNKLMSNPKVWQKSVFIWYYDEHGGYYDHVPPPDACQPDGELPPTYKFDRLGFRTPVAIAAPWVKPGYVSHLDTDITSVTRFIENRFDLPAMTARDANAWPFLDMFDFDAAALATPPSGAPSAQPSQAGLDWCKNNKPGTGLP